MAFVCNFMNFMQNSDAEWILQVPSRPLLLVRCHAPLLNNQI